MALTTARYELTNLKVECVTGQGERGKMAGGRAGEGSKVGQREESEGGSPILATVMDRASGVLWIVSQCKEVAGVEEGLDTSYKAAKRKMDP